MSKYVHLRANPLNAPKLRRIQSRYKKKFPHLHPISLDDIGNVAIAIGLPHVEKKLNIA